MSGSTFGLLFRVTNFGESHGPAIGCVIDGCPPGLELSEADIQPDLDRRRPGTSRHVTQRNEPDAVEILSGVYEGKTTGTPICLLIRNTDQRSKDYGNILDTFRPGHADYTYWRRYGLRDPRGGGRSSARLTAPMVAAGAVAKKWLQQRHGTTFAGWMTQLGDVAIPFEDEAQIPVNPFFAPAGEAKVAELEAYMDALRKSGDSVGARLKVVARGVPVGLGEPLFDKLDADIAHAMMGINAVKGVEIGDGFGVVTQRGSEHGDEMLPAGFASKCRRRARRPLDRPGSGGLDRDQADQLDPHSEGLGQPRRRADDGGDLRPPRSVRGHPRHADRRGDAGPGGDGSCAALARAVRGCRPDGAAAGRKPVGLIRLRSRRRDCAQPGRGACRRPLRSGSVSA